MVRVDEIEQLRARVATERTRIDGAIEVYLDALVDYSLTGSPNERELDRLAHAASTVFGALLGELSRFALTNKPSSPLSAAAGSNPSGRWPNANTSQTPGGETRFEGRVERHPGAE